MTKKNSNFTFLPEVNYKILKDKYIKSYIALIPKDLKTKEDLMLAYEYALKPPYFGRNWDALNEILHDFSWINQSEVIIAHDGLPTELDLKDLITMIDVLAYALQIFKDGPKEDRELPDGKHSLVVIFPSRDKNKIEELLKSSKV
ncbi:MAG: barstar family protein [Patescibacteria group bacterium]|jgi:hypothetical protein